MVRKLVLIFVMLISAYGFFQATLLAAQVYNERKLQEISGVLDVDQIRSYLYMYREKKIELADIDNHTDDRLRSAIIGHRYEISRFTFYLDEWIDIVYDKSTNQIIFSPIPGSE